MKDTTTQVSELQNQLKDLENNNRTLNKKLAKKKERKASEVPDVNNLIADLGMFVIIQEADGFKIERRRDTLSSSNKFKS